MPTLQDITADPEFQGLSFDAQRTVAAQLDPDFARLSVPAQGEVLGRLVGTATTTTPAMTFETYPSAGTVAYKRGITRPVAQFKAGLGAIGDIATAPFRDYPPEVQQQIEAGQVNPFDLVGEAAAKGAQALGVFAPLAAPIEATVGTVFEKAFQSETAGDIASLVAGLTPSVARKLGRVVRGMPKAPAGPAAAVAPPPAADDVVAEAIDVAAPTPAAAPKPPRGAPAADDLGSAAQFRKAPGMAAAAGLETPPPGPMPADRIDPAMFDRLFGHLPPTSRSAMLQVAQDNAPLLNEQTRGVQSVARTEALAAEILPDVSKRLAKGTALNAEQLRAYVNLTGGLQEKIDTLAAKVASGQNDDATKLALSKAYQEFVTTEASLFGARSEAGRSLNILKYQARAGALNDPDFVRQGLKLGVDPDELAAVLSKTDPSDTVGRYRLLRDLQKPGAGDYVKWYYYTNILSGPRTHLRNLIGNTSNLIARPMATPFAAAGDALRVAIKGGEREVYAGEAPRQVYGILNGFPEGFRRAAYMLKNGHTLDDVARLEVRPPEIRGGLATNFVGRGLGAADEFFRTLGASMEEYGGAYTMARKQLAGEGLKGAALREALPDRMAGILADKPLDLIKQVANASARVTFQEGGGPLSRAIMDLRSSVKIPGTNIAPLEFVLPFVKTPANIMKQGIQYSPAGFLTAAGRSGGRVGAQARGEAALGSLLLSFPAWLAANGRLSGSGPKDPAQKDALYAQGWQPNSVKLPLPDRAVDAFGIPRSEQGEYWVSYNYFQPMALPASVMANAYEAWVDTDGKADPAKIAGMVLGKVGNSVLQQSYLRGIFDVANALQDPERFGEGFLQRFAQGWVPGSAALRTAADVQDPTLRDPEGIVEGLRTGIPVQQQDVLPRLRATGEVATRNNPPLVVPEVSPVKRDPLLEETQRLGISLTPAKSSERLMLFKKPVPITRAQDFTIRQAKGRATRAQLERLFANPMYQRADPIQQKYLAEYVMNQARALVSARAAMEASQGRPFTAEQLMGAASVQAPGTVPGPTGMEGTP